MIDYYRRNTTYEMREGIFVRISRRDDFKVHKIVSLLIAGSVLVLVTLLMLKVLLEDMLRSVSPPFRSWDALNALAYLHNSGQNMK